MTRCEWGSSVFTVVYTEGAMAFIIRVALPSSFRAASYHGGSSQLLILLRAQLENRALSWVVSCWVGLWLGWVVPREVGSSARMVRSRPPPLTPADGHHRCFWLRHRPRRAPCARRHRASNVIDRAACCVVAFFWLSSRAFCVPAGGRICVV